MKIEVITNPDIALRQRILFFQFQFMGWRLDDLDEQVDRYNSVPFGYAIAYENDKIIGVINLLKRKIKFQEQDVVLGGIGGVCTHKKFLRRGVATKLLEASMKSLKDANCDVAFLCTNIKKLGLLYSRVGFVPLGRNYRAIGESGKKYGDGNGMIAPLASKRIFENILNDKARFDMQGLDW